MNITVAWKQGQGKQRRTKHDRRGKYIDMEMEKDKDKDRPGQKDRSRTRRGQNNYSLNLQEKGYTRRTKTNEEEKPMK